MKKVITIIAMSSLLTSCVWNKIGNLTIVSTRNVDSKTEYVLKKKEVSGIAKSSNGDAISEAINDALSKNDGEFMKNTKIYINNKGTKVKIVGDVWGSK